MRFRFLGALMKSPCGALLVNGAHVRPHAWIAQSNRGIGQLDDHGLGRLVMDRENPAVAGDLVLRPGGLGWIVGQLDGR